MAENEASICGAPSAPLQSRASMDVRATARARIAPPTSAEKPEGSIRCGRHGDAGAAVGRPGSRRPCAGGDVELDKVG